MIADLDGITVVSVEQAVAAPYASSRLADAGARVIKVERAGGDFARFYDRHVLGQSAYFVWLNRGKEAICLDLAADEDLQLLGRIVARADVFIQNLRPGRLSKLGFGSIALRARYPRLITCDISGFGTEGPCTALKAYDLIVQGESGLCAITGNAAGPARVGVSVCDIAAGMTAHAAILQALIARNRSGRGRSIQVSLFDSIADWMNVPLLQFIYGEQEPTRSGVSHPTIAPYGAYTTADGVHIILAVQNEREWELFCKGFLGAPELTRDPRFADNTARVINRHAVDACVNARFTTLSAIEATQLLVQSDIAHGRLNGIRDAAVHPHLRFLQVDTPAGEIRIVAPAAGIVGELQSLRRVPGLDEHGRSIRAEFASDT